ncbi:heavy metal-binding domain-containing protein [Streptacidiphilus sp. P02-A3a]|uniref:heavy metal-binding domain-containing protein n=1 Tax=Streptacidiphilus sp. P02-A3a TaxID=2704468 RepID=UPI0015FE29E3|nr:heavy metal-binding domain-containing protein [Streptacidiphilus sp. P02-A3a]QMU69610.1 heavy metal-binding domain-containing protein [Streptacidiphilus sp. P02-A3a]
MLSPRGFAAIRVAGFDSVGRVRGTASYHVELSGETGGWHAHDCRFSPASTGPAPVALSGAGAPSAVLVEVLEGARRRALERLRTACAGLGGHGVVGVQVGIAPSEVEPLGMDFTVSGTAVRARGVANIDARPFVTHLVGEGFAKLVLAGWVPVDLLVGRSIGVRHEDVESWSQLHSVTNREVDGWTALLGGVRADARSRLRRQAAELGGDGVLLNGAELTVGEQRCQAESPSPGRDEPTDRVAHCTIVGTSIARFTSGSAGAHPLTMIPLHGTTARRI